jgi:hypothetical protein
MSTAELYGMAHRRKRAEWQARIDGGEKVYCARCGNPIVAGSRWQLGHNHIAGGYLGPEHARCNLADRNRRNNWKLRRRRKPIASRPW